MLDGAVGSQSRAFFGASDLASDEIRVMARRLVHERGKAVILDSDDVTLDIDIGKSARAQGCHLSCDGTIEGLRPVFSALVPVLGDCEHC